MQNNQSRSKKIHKKNESQTTESVVNEVIKDQTKAEKMTQPNMTISSELDNKTSLFKAIKALKDHTLIISLFCYICGFFLWSFYLYRYDTGFLIIHDINLIISGLFPVSLIICIFYIKDNFEKVSIKYIKIFKDTSLESLSKNPKLGFYISIVLFFIIIVTNTKFLIIDELLMIMFLALLPLGIATLNEDLFNRKLNPSFYYSIILYAIAASFTVFLSIPQEFGGAKPRYVSLDVDSAKFSANTLKSLGLKNTDKPQTTDPVVMLYSNSDYIVAKTISSEDAITLKNRYVSSVRAVDDKELKEYTNRVAERDRYLRERNLQNTCQLIRTPYLSICPTPVPLRHFANPA